MDKYYWIERGFQWLGSMGIFTFGTLSISAAVGFVFKKTFLEVLKYKADNHKSKLREREEDHKSELRKREEDHKSELRKRESDFKKILDKQVEDHKSRLREKEEDFKSILNKQLEEHKSELKKINDKYQIQFSKLHVDRAETIKCLYGKLVKVQTSAHDLLGSSGMINRTVDKTISPEKMQELISKATTDTNDLAECFKNNRIYFSEEICNSFINIIGQMYSIIPHFYQYSSSDDTPTTEEDILMREGTDKVVAEHILDVIPKLKYSLEDEFRKLLGVIEEK